MQNLTKMQYILLYAHLAHDNEKREGTAGSGVTKEEADVIWKKKLEEARQRSLHRREEKDNLVQLAQNEIIKNIEEKQNNAVRND